jgi:hypothetical protein
MDSCAIGFPNFRWNSFLIWAASGRCCPVVRTVALQLHAISILRLRCPDQGNGCSDGWSDARNFHISSSRVRTMKTVVRTFEFWIRYLPYGWAHLDGNPHRPDGCRDLSISVFLDGNPIAGRTLSVVRTCCWNVQTNSSWSSLKLLDIDEGPDGKFSSLGRMMLWIVKCPDGISRCPNGCKGSDFSDL